MKRIFTPRTNSAAAVAQLVQRLNRYLLHSDNAYGERDEAGDRRGHLRAKVPSSNYISVYQLTWQLLRVLLLYGASSPHQSPSLPAPGVRLPRRATVHRPLPRPFRARDRWGLPRVWPPCVALAALLSVPLGACSRPATAAEAGTSLILPVRASLSAGLRAALTHPPVLVRPGLKLTRVLNCALPFRTERPVANCEVGWQPSRCLRRVADLRPGLFRRQPQGSLNASASSS